MGILVQNEWRHKAIFTTILLMLGSLFISRALLSMSMMLFVLLTTASPQIIRQFRKFLQSPFLLSISLLFFIPLISGCWSSDKHEWSEVLIVKLPFLLLPVAFAGDWRLKEDQWRTVALVFIAFTVLASCWSLLQYFLRMGSIHESYLRAKTIPTLMDDDHVRFSWVVSLAVITAFLLLEKFPEKNQVWLILPVIILAGYLHVLSARTGLVMLYFFLVSYAGYKFRRKPRFSIAIITALIVMIAVGWFCFPTFQNRIKYNLYDLSFVLKNEYRPGTSDGNRVASLKAGWALLKDHPLTGVGAGDIWQEVGGWYDGHVDGIKGTDKLYPSNEWLVHGCMAGWPGILLFTGIIFLPLYIRNMHYRYFWIMLHLLAVSAFLVETSLEMQHGIFIYLFFGLWWWKWLSFEKNNEQFALIVPATYS